MKSLIKSLKDLQNSLIKKCTSPVLTSGVKLLLIHNWFKKCWWTASYVFSRIWNFQGYQRNSMWNFQGLIKSKMEFPKGDQEKIMWKFQGSVFGLGISKGSNTILWNIQGLSFVLSGISRGKVKNWKIPGGFQKSISSTLPVWIFPGTAQYTGGQRTKYSVSWM